MSPYPIELSTGLGPFTSYINTAGADRARVIAEQIERKTNPEALAWWCYQRALSGLRAALLSPNPAEELERMVAEAPARMGGHYREIADGIGRLLQRERCTLVPAATGSWQAEGLRVELRQCLGLRRPDGTTVCAHPYFNKDLLRGPVAAGPVRLIELAIPTMLPGATPALLEVRTGKLHRPNTRRNNQALDDWLHVEARAYRDHWERGLAA